MAGTTFQREFNQNASPTAIASSFTDPAVAAAMATSPYDWTGGATGAQTDDTLAEVLLDHVSVMRFIPKTLRAAIRARTSTTDLSTYLQAAVDWATANNEILFWPRGRYSYGTTLTATLGRLRMCGGFYLGATLRYTGAGIALQITPPVGGDNTYYDITNLEIVPSAAGGGTGGIYITLASGAFFRNWNINRVLIGEFGGPGLTLDNTAANTDGFFTGVIENSYITNGINGIKVGDSNRILCNTISCLDTYVGIALTGIGYLARQTNIIDNNITGRSGALYLKGMAGVMVEHNQLEHSTAAGDYNGSLSGHVVLEDCQYCEVVENTISPGNPTNKATSAVRILGASTIGINVEKNQIAKGQTNHIKVEDGKHSHVPDNGNRYTDATANLVAPVISDAGIGTKGIWTALGSLLVNSWVDDGSTNPPVACRKSREGVVELRGQVSSGTSTVLTLPVGYRPSYADVWYVSRAFTTTGAEISVSVAGAVAVPAAGSATNIRLNQVRFLASPEL